MLGKFRTPSAVGVVTAAVLTTMAVPSAAEAGTPGNSCDPATQAFSTRYTVSASSEDFLRVGAISTANGTDAPIDLQQTLSTTQTLTASGNITMSYQGIGGTIGGSYQLSWTLGQNVGPYSIKPGETGRATYGFDVVRFTGTAQTCLPWGQWGHDQPIWGFAPLDLHVVIDRYPNGQATPAPVGIPVDQATAGLKKMSK
ncbi:hypothetical protein [Amycolatopsis silviterrae]|uniref:Allene oxide cyclase barrel-like domain-containing protein n=1 Tax=Amycolatopsis silviterrae TaxID=1656914 RepID=A0ABW5H8B2_9PSEU